MNKIINEDDGISHDCNTSSGCINHGASLVAATVTAVALTATAAIVAPAIVVATAAVTVSAVAAATVVPDLLIVKLPPPSSPKCLDDATDYATDDASLHRSEQTITSLLDTAYWERCCPWLHCQRTDSEDTDINEFDETHDADADADADMKISAEEIQREAYYTNELKANGYFKVDRSKLEIPPDLVKALVKGILRLLELGHSASAISSYDEAWELQKHVGPMISRITGNPLSGDIFSFHVTADKQSGFVGPHRDKPLADNSTFRKDGSPMYATCWICLTPATNTSSCLYFIPKNDDNGYHIAGDSLDVVLPNRLTWQNIVSEPCQPGDILCFSHRVVHWASKARKCYDSITGHEIIEPRIALSFAVADHHYEQPNFIHHYKNNGNKSSSKYKHKHNHPSIGLRVGLTAAQAILYNEQVPLKRHELALNNRIFCSSKHLFQQHYIDRVCGEAQYLKFKLKNGTIAKNIDQTRDIQRVSV